MADLPAAAEEREPQAFAEKEAAEAEGFYYEASMGAHSRFIHLHPFYGSDCVVVRVPEDASITDDEIAEQLAQRVAAHKIGEHASRFIRDLYAPAAGPERQIRFKPGALSFFVKPIE